MHYSFELCGDESSDEHLVEELASFEEARTVAIGFASQVLANRTRNRPGDQEWCLNVKDDRGIVVYRLEVRSVEARPFRMPRPVMRQ